MDKTKLLDILFTPLVVAADYRWISWTMIFFATLWLLCRYFFHLQYAFKASIVAWWVIEVIALISILCVSLLYLLSPKGPDFYRVYIGFLAGIPLVIPGLICLFVPPHKW
jgi:hypothetical protein